MSDTPASSVEMVKWLRSKAAEYTRLADDIERVFPINNGAPQGQEDGTDEPIDHPGPTVNLIVSAMNGRSLRLPTLAAELGVDEDAVHPVLTADNGFTRNERGWYTYGQKE